MNNYMNFEGHNIEVFEFEGQILFNPYDAGRCLGISDGKTRKLISKVNYPRPKGHGLVTAQSY